MTKRSNAVKRQSKWKRQAGKVVLIITQAKETEPNYFNKFQNSNLRILCTKYPALTKIDQLKKYVKSLKQHEGYNFDEIWIVIDVEECENLQSCRELQEQAAKIKIGTALSNPEFEIWFLLHFMDRTAQITKPDLQEELKQLFIKHDLGKYDKNRNDIYRLLKDRQLDAIARAGKSGTGKLSNPGTTVDRLVNRLNEIAD